MSCILKHYSAEKVQVLGAINFIEFIVVSSERQIRLSSGVSQMHLWQSGIPLGRRVLLSAKHKRAHCTAGLFAQWRPSRRHGQHAAAG